MAKVTADRFLDIRNFGEYGDCAVANDGKTFAAQANGDTLDLFQIGGQCTMLDGHVVAGALGAGVTISIGWRYADGSAGGSATALLAATVMNTAGLKTTLSMAPITVDKDVIIYATIGVGAATGRVDCVLFYRPQGTK